MARLIQHVDGDIEIKEIPETSSEPIFKRLEDSGAQSNVGVICRASHYWHWRRRDKIDTTKRSATRRGEMARRADLMHAKHAQRIDSECQRSERRETQRATRAEKRALRKAKRQA